MIVSRIEELLDVQVHLDDVLPQHVCPKCKCRLERGTKDLQDFRSQAHTSYECLLAAHMGTLKCTTTNLANRCVSAVSYHPGIHGDYVHA